MQYVKSICVKYAIMHKLDWQYWYAVMQKKIAKYAIMQKALGGPHYIYASNSGEDICKIYTISYRHST